MWIEETKNGKFKAVERYTNPLTGEQKRVSVTIDKNTAVTRKKAQITLEEKIRNILLQITSVKQDITFGRLVDLWQEYQSTTVKKSTYTRNCYVSNKLVKILDGKVYVEKMHAGYVMALLMQDDNKPSTVNERLTRFKSIIRWGYDFDYVSDVSWLKKLKPLEDKEKVEKLSEKYMESDELKKLLDGMKIERWKIMTKFLALTGLRVGEAFALRPEDLDIQERQIHVVRTLDVANDIFTTPKTRTSFRDVYITDELLPLCKSLRSNALQDKLTGGNGMIFYKGKNDYYAYEKYFRNATEKIVGKKLTVHALRHTHTSLLAEQGVSLEIISRRLGHESSEITKKVYMHVTEKLKEKENEQLKSVSLL